MAHDRPARVAEEFQHEISAILARGLKDPRIGMLTLSRVEVSPDYAHAKVRFSLLVGDPHDCETALNEAAGWLRNGLFKRLAIHTVPTLHFHFDRTTERAADLMRAGLAQYAYIPRNIEAYSEYTNSPREFFFWMLTLENGIANMRANLAWAESVIERIQTGQVPEK